MLCFYKTAVEARTPYRGSRGACGIDLPIPHSVTLEGHQKVSVDLFLQVGLPPGHFGLLKLRSGAARRHKLLLHGGVIGENSNKFGKDPVCHRPFPADPDYKGSIVLLLENIGDTPIEFRGGEAYVQLVAVKYFCGPVLGAKDFCFRSERLGGSFGSTDVVAESVAALFAQDAPPVTTTPASDGDEVEP